MPGRSKEARPNSQPTEKKLRKSSDLEVLSGSFGARLAQTIVDKGAPVSIFPAEKEGFLAINFDSPVGRKIFLMSGQTSPGKAAGWLFEAEDAERIAAGKRETWKSLEHMEGYYKTLRQRLGRREKKRPILKTGLQ